MRDLRRRALESNKTVSRKALSKRSTPATSRSNSRAPSCVASGAVSRAGSDDEDTGGELSDETSFSVGSLNEILNSETTDTTSLWRSDLVDRIAEIIDRKRSSGQGREKCLASYVHTLTAQYAQDEISGKEEELVAAFLKSIKAETSEKETVLALKAAAMTLITSPSDVIYDSVATPLKHTISESGFVPTKTAAIHTLGVCTFFGGASEDEVLDNMAYLLEIAASDGQSIYAEDEATPVTAALEEWGFLATLADELSSELEEALVTFTDQLSSTYPAVQIAAGENIALLYEKFEVPVDGVLSSNSGSSTGESDGDAPRSRLANAHPAFRNTHELETQLSDLASLSTHSISKKDLKSIRTNFSDILNSVQHPGCGPRYHNATDRHDKVYGSRMKVKIGQDGVMKIDNWWKLHRLQGLRRILQGGFVTHYECNSVVFDSLPIMIEMDFSESKQEKRKKTAGPRFLTVPDE